MKLYRVEYREILEQRGFCRGINKDNLLNTSKFSRDHSVSWVKHGNRVHFNSPSKEIKNVEITKITVLTPKPLGVNNV